MFILGKRYFTFQSGYIQINLGTAQADSVLELYIPIWLYSNQSAADDVYCHVTLYIPIWLYSNRLAGREKILI